MLLLTFRELWSRRVVVGLFVLSTLVWLLLAYALDFEPALPAGMAEEFGPDGPSREFLMQRLVDARAGVIAGLSYWGSILLALFAVVPLFGSFTAAGHAELLLAKPMSRAQLFAGHVAGVLALMLLLATYLIGAVWLVIGLKTGIWVFRFLLTIPLLVGVFGALYAAVTLVQIATNSVAVGLLTAFGLIFLSMPFQWHAVISAGLSGVEYVLFQAAYYALPHVAEGGNIVAALAAGDPVASWTPLWLTLAAGAVYFGLTTYWFSRRDF